MLEAFSVIQFCDSGDRKTIPSRVRPSSLSHTVQTKGQGHPHAVTTWDQVSFTVETRRTDSCPSRPKFFEEAARVVLRGTSGLMSTVCV